MPKTFSHPKYRRHRASSQAVVTLDGRDFYLGRFGTAESREKYDRLILEWSANGRQLPTDPGEDLTLVEVSAAYKRYAHGYYRKNGQPTDTYYAIERTLKLVCSLYGRTAAEEFSPRAVKAILQKMIALDWSRKFINDNLATIKRMLKWAVTEELVSPAVFQAVSALPGLRKGRSEARETEPVRPIDDKTVEQTLTRLGPVAGAMLRVQRLTGMRPGEVCVLRPCDLDTSGEVWLYRPQEHKTEHHGLDRVVAIGPRAQEVLRPYLERPAEEYCFSPAEADQQRRAAASRRRRTPMSCGNKPGSNRKAAPSRKPSSCYDNASYRRAIHRACDLAFPPPPNMAAAAARKWRSDHRWSPNRLRHSAATEIRRRFGLESAQVVLGHQQAQITEVYAERDLARAVEVAKEIG
jgi:integrase